MIATSMDFGPLNRFLGKLEEKTKDFSAPIRAIGERTQEQLRTTFDQEGPGWAPNVRGHHPILVKTGKLRDSFTLQGAKGNVFIVTPHGGEFGSNLPYAHELQDGAPRPKAAKRRGKRRGLQRSGMPGRSILTGAGPVLLGQMGTIMAEHFFVGGSNV